MGRHRRWEQPRIVSLSTFGRARNDRERVCRKHRQRDRLRRHGHLQTVRTDPKLRDLPLEARIIRDTGSEADLEGVTVYHKPAEVYPRGSVVIEHTFTEPGRFVGLVTVGDQVSRFPFAVGTRGRRVLILYAVFGAVALVAGGLLFLYANRNG